MLPRMSQPPFLQFILGKFCLKTVPHWVDFVPVPLRPCARASPFCQIQTMSKFKPFWLRKKSRTNQHTACIHMLMRALHPTAITSFASADLEKLLQTQPLSMRTPVAYFSSSLLIFYSHLLRLPTFIQPHTRFPIDFAIRPTHYDSLLCMYVCFYPSMLMYAQTHKRSRSCNDCGHFAYMG